jgi:hypothetical protein
LVLLRRSMPNRRDCLTPWQKRTSRKPSKNGRDGGWELHVLQGWSWPIGRMVSFVIFTSVRNILDIPRIKTANPLQAWTGPEVSRIMRLPDFMIIGTWMWLSALRTARIYTQEICLVLISVSDWVGPRAIVKPEGLGKWKILMKPPGNETAAFRLAA